MTGIIRRQRAVKSPYEVELIKTGQKAAEVLITFWLIKAGLKDYELAAKVEYEFRKGRAYRVDTYPWDESGFFLGQVLVGKME